jgi:hypothetical protein
MRNIQFKTTKTELEDFIMKKAAILLVTIIMAGAMWAAYGFIPKDDPELTVPYRQEIAVFAPKDVIVARSFEVGGIASISMAEYEQMSKSSIQNILSVSILLNRQHEITAVEVDYYGITATTEGRKIFSATETYPLAGGKTTKWGEFRFDRKNFSIDAVAGKVYLPMTYSRGNSSWYLAWTVFIIVFAVIYLAGMVAVFEFFKRRKNESGKTPRDQEPSAG